MQNMQDYKCPCCGGAIAFDSTIQKMKCPYCDSEFEMETLQSMDEQLKEGKSDSMGETKSWRRMAGRRQMDWSTYVCQSCRWRNRRRCNDGGNRVRFVTIWLFSRGKFGCAQTGSGYPIQAGQESRQRRTDETYFRKRLLPKVFKDQNHIDEIKGVYVPFWLFDTDADAQVSYKANIRTWSDSQYIYTETRYFPCQPWRQHWIWNIFRLTDHLRCRMILMEPIEPFDILEAVEFSDGVFCRLFANKYDVTG